MGPVDQNNASTAMELTEDEAELYDRQIRLWGVESQKRLRATKILLIGVEGVGAEIAKNIILSGVKSVCLLDSGVVTKEDVNTAQFLAPHEDIGKNRAKSSEARAQNLNPNVEVTSNETKVDEISEEFVHGFDVVIATGCNPNQLIKIDDFCRSKKSGEPIKFFTADVFGMFGYAFADLQQYKWFKEKSLDEEIVSYSSLKEVLNIDLKADEEFKKIAIKNPAYLLFLVLQNFHKTQGRYPLPEHRTEDIELLKSARSSVLDSLTEDPVTALPDEYFTNVFSKLAPTCAITGGIVCQEVTAAISQKQVLFNNMFLFSPVTHIGYFFKALPTSATVETKSNITNIEMVDEIL
ncbi:hypothetical protein M8J77_001588 [Diaphorina citri]|nr:hypothetical protein M8J77_001588 [Diaphorina citri]